MNERSWHALTRWRAVILASRSALCALAAENVFQTLGAVVARPSTLHGFSHGMTDNVDFHLPAMRIALQAGSRARGAGTSEPPDSLQSLQRTARPNRRGVRAEIFSCRQCKKA